MERSEKRIRVLFASIGWPCGVLELASWIERRAVARAVVAPLVAESPLAVDPRAFRAVVARLSDCSVAGQAEMTAHRIFGLLGSAFVGRLLSWRPHVVGFRIEGGQFETVCDGVRMVRSLSDATVVLGGPTVTCHPRETLLESGADYAFVGEAESSLETFLRLAKRPSSRDLAPSVPGLVYRWGGDLLVNLPPRKSKEERARPAVDIETLRANRLDWDRLHGFERVPIESLFFTGGRGCPGRCTFCARLHGTKVRVKSAGQLIEEIRGADRLVRQGRLSLGRWPLFRHTEIEDLRGRSVGWAAIYDEDFFLDRRRAIEFFRLWDASRLRWEYRLNVQTNPLSLLVAGDRIDAELFEWIDRLKPMIQLGAESFHPLLLERWRKRHRVDQLWTVLEALETTRQDYNIFHLLTDFESTPEEVLDAVWLLARAAVCFPRMRIANSPFTIPLYDSDARRRLDYAASPRARRPRNTHFTDFESPQPEWMDPLTVELADLADECLADALELETRDAAIRRASGALAERVAAWQDDPRVNERLAAGRLRDFVRQATWQAEDALR